MTTPIKPEDVDVTLKFGGGLHTRASEDEIDPREAHDGSNFLLDLENRELRNRPPFDLIGTVPNAAQINGGACLVKADGTISVLIQAGTAVYEWNGLTGFTSKGTVSSSAKLRGHWRSHNFTLDDVVLITDLSLVETVKQWDGTTFQGVTFTDEDDIAFGNFYAKYLSVSNERAVFSYIRDPSTTTPHMMVGSLRGDYTQISVGQRPSSALSEQDPFFLLTPDLRPINGHVEAFGATVLSTEKGRLFNLTGASAKDFAFSDFYPGSQASGDESISYIGNDVIYGRQGRIESVSDTNKFGDSESDDLTVQIADQVSAYPGWTIVYNGRLNRAYCFPDGQSEVWVFNTAMRGGKLSPWMKWTTSHALAFRPTFVMSMLDPIDGLEYIFMGDASGNFYRMEGTGASGDAGSANVAIDWKSKLFSAKLDAKVYNVTGWIKYRKGDAATVTITLEYAGMSAFNEQITVAIPAIGNRPVYSGGLYYSDGNYYGTAFDGRLIRQPFVPAGQSNEFQVRVQWEGTTDLQINEIGIRLRQAS